MLEPICCRQVIVAPVVVLAISAIILWRRVARKQRLVLCPCVIIVLKDRYAQLQGWFESCRERLGVSFRRVVRLNNEI